jgi:hypothetical protein
MARQEQPRENLIAEATALVERVELLLAGVPQPIVAGFRLEGSASLFFGDDPVYQFNARGDLRRAFVDGRLYKADGGRIVEMTRQRQADRIQLLGHELPAAAAKEFVAALHSRLSDLAGKLLSGQVQVVAQVPPDGEVVARLGRWLAAHGERIEIASSPHAR